MDTASGMEILCKAVKEKVGGKHVIGGCDLGEGGKNCQCKHIGGAEALLIYINLHAADSVWGGGQNNAEFIFEKKVYL